MSRVFKTAAAVLIIFAAVLLVRQSFIFYLTRAYPKKYSDLVEKYSAMHNVEKELVYAVIKTESGFRPKALSPVGARGLMQIIPETFAWAQVKRSEPENLNEDALFDPEINIKYGTYILSLLLNEFKDNDVALCAYHAGRGKVMDWLGNKQYSSDGKRLEVIPSKVTLDYVRKVNKAKNIYQKLYKGG